MPLAGSYPRPLSRVNGQQGPKPRSRAISLPRLSRLRTFDSWIAYRNYRMLWIGNFFANSAEWFQLLSVGWLVRDLTEGSSTSSLLVVTVGALNTLPGLVVGPWGGVLGDRIDRRKLVMAVQTSMALLAFTFALLVLSGRVQVWHVYVYVLISGSLFSINQPMRQALIANTVPREALGNAYAANVITITGTRLIGPFLGGVLIATLGFFWNFTIEALLYICMVIAFLPMKTPYYQSRVTTHRESPLANLKEGIRYVWTGERSIFYLMLLSIVPNVVLQPVVFLLPVFTAEVLHRGPDVGGYLLAATGFGGLMSALTIASVGFILKKGLLCLAAAAVSSICVILLAQSHWLLPSVALIASMSFGLGTYRTTNGTLIQELVPDTLRGRITSLQDFGRSFLVATSLLVGWFAGFASVPLAMVSAGSVGLVLAICFLMTMHRVRQLL